MKSYKKLYLKRLDNQPQVFCVASYSQYWLTSTFIRIQEYYESPLESIRGKHFTLEKFSDLYAERYGNFTYYTEWAGFNIPGHIVRQFFQVFTDLSEKEKSLFRILKPALKSERKFYVIGILDDKDVGRVLKHELAHAMYYLNSKFRQEMDEAIPKMTPSIRKRIFHELKEMGYDGRVKKDELQAYLSTSTANELTRVIGKRISPRHFNPFRKIYRQHISYDKI